MTSEEAERLQADVERWLTPCPPCDYGLVEFGGCACPEGDPRSVMSRLWHAYQEALRRD